MAGQQHRRLNILLLVIDSLRAQELNADPARSPKTPFLRGLQRETTCFRRAYATDCWTLPTHASIFTGLLPSEHQAHFQTMAYTQSAPTIAELLAAAGYHTEAVTRNPIFDGTIPGITRGFRANTQLLAERHRLDPLALFLAASKPRFRRQINGSGFFHPLQRANREFVNTFARATLPADRRVLTYVLERAAQLRRQGRPFFLFGNLYDVHAPYPPSETSILRPFWSPRGVLENVMMPFVLPCLGSHTYLRPGFRLSHASRLLLLGRYHRAIELMDTKLAEFYGAARTTGVLDDTLLIITSDHGEAFGEHDLYLHDASAYETHLHVPLWVHHPERVPTIVDEIVSTRDLFHLMRAVGLQESLDATVFDANYRAACPIALAQHFYYPHRPDMHPRYKQNIAAAIAGNNKVILRSERVESYDLARDRDETRPVRSQLSNFEAVCRRDGLDPKAVSDALERLRAWTAWAGRHPKCVSQRNVNDHLPQ